MLSAFPHTTSLVLRGSVMSLRLYGPFSTTGMSSPLSPPVRAIAAAAAMMTTRSTAMIAVIFLSIAITWMNGPTACLYIKFNRLAANTAISDFIMIKNIIIDARL